MAPPITASQNSPEFYFQLQDERDAVQCDRHVAAEWQAHNAGRDFSIWPRGWQPLPPRPNGVSFDDDDYLAMEIP